MWRERDEYPEVPAALRRVPQPLGHPQDVAHLANGRLELVGDLVGSRLASQLLHELPLDVHDLVELLDHVYGDPDRPTLVGDRPGDGLADPPGRVRGELVAAAIV